MRLALFALVLTLPLTACDPDANTETPTVETVPVDPAPSMEEAPGDTGLPDPDSLVDAPGIDVTPPIVEGADAPPPPSE